MKANIVKIIAAIISVFMLAMLAFLYIRYAEHSHNNAAKAFFDYQAKQLHKHIDELQNSALALSVLLKENEQIIGCFDDKKREICVKNVENIIKSLSSVAMFKNIKIHLHASNAKSVLRSWDTERYGDDLKSFRYLLSEVERTGNPAVGIERGVAGTFIRAAANVMDENEKKLGTIEIMLDFHPISEFFSDQGIDLFVLLDKKINFSRQSQPDDAILRDYFLANAKSANLNLLNALEKLQLNKNGFFVSGSHYFAISSMIDASGKRVGSFVLHIDKSYKIQDKIFLNPLF